MEFGEGHPEARAEAFNLLSHTVFALPSTSLASSNFGKILRADEPWIMQFALKYTL